MAKKAPAKPAARRKPRNAIVDAAPQIVELAKRMEAERARIIAEMAAEEEAKKKPCPIPPSPQNVPEDVAENARRDAEAVQLAYVDGIEIVSLPDDIKRELLEIYRKRADAKKPIAPSGNADVLPLSAKSSSPWRRFMLVGAAVAGLAVSFCGGVWSAGGWQIGPGPVVRNDVLQQSYEADRITQAAVLRDYAAQGFKNDDAGRASATKWFNDNRFRNRGPDFRPYTSAVTDHFAAGTLAKFADELEGK